MQTSWHMLEWSLGLVAHTSLPPDISQVVQHVLLCCNGWDSVLFVRAMEREHVA